MRATAPLLCFAALAACASPARFDGSDEAFAATVTPPPPPVAAELRLVSAIESEGCVMTADNVASVLVRANLTQAELTQITPALAQAGRLEVAGDGAIRVLTERCA